MKLTPKVIEKLGAELETEVQMCGAALVPGVVTGGVEQFRKIIDELGYREFSYRGGNSPRKGVAERIYTASEYPPELPITLHNELSYMRGYPNRLLFYCETPAQRGGETLLLENRALTATLNPSIVEIFFKKGLLYRQRMHSGFGLGLSWQETFATTDQRVVESFCRENEIQFTWIENGGLEVVYTRPAFRTDQNTGERLWFNQADQWHFASANASLGLSSSGVESLFPHDCSFGDGSPIPVEWINTIRDRAFQSAASLRLASGDLLVVDNERVAHGRRPFSGGRKFYVSLNRSL